MLGCSSAERIAALRAATELEWAISPLWQVALVSSYSGYSHRLDTLDVQLTRDLHCLTATLTYSQALNQLTFAVGIKAFPSPLQTYGIGRGGEQFQTLPGQYF
mgnify:CR=1 FL=1